MWSTLYDSELDEGALSETPARSSPVSIDDDLSMKNDAFKRCGYSIRREFIYTLGGEYNQTFGSTRPPSIVDSASIGLKAPNVSWHGSRTIGVNSIAPSDTVDAVKIQSELPNRIKNLEAILEVRYGFRYPSNEIWERYNSMVDKTPGLSVVERVKSLLWRGIYGSLTPHTRAGAWEMCLHGDIDDFSPRWEEGTYEPNSFHSQLVGTRVAYWTKVENEYWHLLRMEKALEEDTSSRRDSKKGSIHWQKRELQQIRLDLRRTTVDGMPCINRLFCQCLMERVLWTWSYDHQDCGYVQGQNDILLYFVVVYLSAVCNDLTDNNSLESLDLAIANTIEADIYRAFCTVMNQIRDNFDPGLEGVHRMTRHLRDLAGRIDPSLVVHLERHDVNFIQFSVRWIINLLARELPLCCILRLWDTYIAEGVEKIRKFHIFVCAIFLAHWSSTIQRLNEFQSIILFLQDLPTELWKIEDMDMLLSEAFVLQKLYGESPSHWLSDYTEG